MSSARPSFSPGRLQTLNTRAPWESRRASASPADAQCDGLDLPLPVAPTIDGAGGGDRIAHARERVRPEPALDVYRTDAGRADRLDAGEEEGGVAVAARIDGLDVQDAAARRAAPSRRARRAGPRAPPRGVRRARLGATRLGSR